jgi:hypothetical protein
MRTLLSVCPIILLVQLLLSSNTFPQKTDSKLPLSMNHSQDTLTKRPLTIIDEEVFTATVNQNTTNIFGSDPNPCAVENQDNLLKFPGFFGQFTQVPSPDVLLPFATSYPHSNVSVFVDPNNKSVVSTADMTKYAIHGNQFYFNSWYLSDKRGTYWMKQEIINDNESYSNPTLVINNRKTRFVCYLGYFGTNPNPPNEILTDVRIEVAEVGSGLPPYIRTINSPNALYRDTYLFDKPHLMVDNSSNSEYAGNLYCAFTPINVQTVPISPYPFCGQIEMSRSTDGGNSWQESWNDNILSKSVFYPDSTFNIGANIQT